MKPFLQVIAEAYSKRYSDLSDFIFVFPNRRSGTFFRHYLNKALPKGKIVFAPRITTISDLATEISGRFADNRFDLLFTLFDAYCEISSEQNRQMPEFDSFRKWGEVVLSDFNDVDMSYVDAAEIFSNLRDFREIETDYLTEEQRNVMSQYFGIADFREHFDHFWKAYDYRADNEENAEKHTTEIKERFSQLWQILSELYTKFNQKLEKENLSYPGLAYRLAADKIHEKGSDAIEARKIVFIGFNALTKCEWLMFTNLKKLLTDTEIGEEPFADFLWDDSSSFLADEKSSAGRFIRKDIKQFPHPQWINLEECNAAESMPAITIISSPSNAYQAKIAGETISQIARKKCEELKIEDKNKGSESDCSDIDLFADAATAVVLPDETMLLPILYSIPKEAKNINLTMGFSLKLTSASSYVQLLRRLQRSKRTTDGQWCFYAPEVIKLFSHPFLIAICGTTAVMKLRNHIQWLRKYQVSTEDIVEFCPKAEPLLYPLEGEDDALKGASYLHNAINLAYDALINRPDREMVVKTRLDTDYLQVYDDAVRRLLTAVEAHQLRMNYSTFFSLTDRLLISETVNFEGEPLEGLQIMGMLETRCLDFDHIIIPSLNERIMPRRFRTKSFIPAGLRKAYGMASTAYEESLFAYYFYRLIGRAKTVTLIYDARDAGPQTDPSRYIQQLKYLYAKDNLTLKNYTFSLNDSKRSKISISKTPQTVEVLREFLNPKSREAFSASSLLRYLDCPLKFYFSKILKLSVEEKPMDGLSPIMIGNIIHRFMMEIYLGEENSHKYIPQGISVSKEKIESILSDDERFNTLLRHCINRELFKNREEKIDTPLNPGILMSAKPLGKQIRNILRRDLKLAPFKIYGAEFTIDCKLPLSNGLSANLTCTIDRLDSAASPQSEADYRIVDYKTGNIHLWAEEPQLIFSGDFTTKHLYQLQLYANILNIANATGSSSAAQPVPYELAIYNVPRISDDNKSYPSGMGVAIPKVGGDWLLNHLSLNFDDKNLNDLFLDELVALIERILDPEIPFTSTDNEAACAYCDFRDGFCSLCRADSENTQKSQENRPADAE